MTPMDTFIQNLRQSENELERVLPVIVVSGHTERRRVEAARDAGATEIDQAHHSSRFVRPDREWIFRPRPFVRSPAIFAPPVGAHNDGYIPWRRQSDRDEAPVLSDISAPPATPRPAAARHPHSVP
jgi:hypothetical protein